jgi:hypothetical protein
MLCRSEIFIGVGLGYHSPIWVSEGGVSKDTSLLFSFGLLFCACVLIMLEISLFNPKWQLSFWVSGFGAF